MKLTELNPDQIARIESMDGDDEFVSRIMEMGFSVGKKVRFIKGLPFKGPIQIRLRNFLVSLRYEDASKIKVDIDI